jgi:integrase
VVNKKPKTLQNEKCFWDQFWAWSGAPTLRSVRRSDVAEWQQHLLNEEGNSPVSINNKVRQVSTVWNWLKREEIYDGPNPFAGRKPLDEGPRKLRVIPWEKMKELLQVAEEGADLAAREAATDPDSLKKRNLARSRRSLYLALVLGAYAGLRRKEILAVRWEHIDWERKELQVHGTKSEASHATVHLHETLESALLPYRKDAGYLVMAGKRTSRAKDRKHPVEYRYDYKSAWTTLRKKVGLQDARWHDLRHSFATRLLDLGYSMKDIAIMLRHSSTRPTERYADLRVLKVRIGSLDGAPATSADEEDAA